jgi:hypothetical protein
MKIWEYKFVGDMLPKTIKAATFDDAIGMIRQFSSNELLYVRYVAY